jgi:cobalt-zinc-cadmium resistance protein CzcA
MLRSLVAWSLSYRLVVIGLTMVVGVLGAVAYASLPVDAYPNIA